MQNFDLIITFVLSIFILIRQNHKRILCSFKNISRFCLYSFDSFSNKLLYFIFLSLLFFCSNNFLIITLLIILGKNLFLSLIIFSFTFIFSSSSLILSFISLTYSSSSLHSFSSSLSSINLSSSSLSISFIFSSLILLRRAVPGDPVEIPGGVQRRKRHQDGPDPAV